LEPGIALPVLSWLAISSDNKPGWLREGARGQHLQGSEALKATRVEKATGRFGGEAIDFQVSVYIGGVPLTVYSGDVVD
jgi:hypothetical protein